MNEKWLCHMKKMKQNKKHIQFMNLKNQKYFLYSNLQVTRRLLKLNLEIVLFCLEKIYLQVLARNHKSHLVNPA
jgi:hypothetical protein